MPQIENLVLFQKVCDFISFVHPYVAKFPKNERFVLGQKIEDELLSFVKLLMLVNKKTVRVSQDADALCLRLDVAQVYIRLAHTMKFINTSSYLRISERLQECTRLCYGYCKPFSSISVVESLSSARERG
ncbi:MAG: four helix bundle protein [Candidatus Aquicultor sp.]